MRSHEDLVRIQHVIASQIDATAEHPEARADCEVDGDIAAIWEFASNDEEGICLADWISHEVESGNVEPHDIAILVRMRLNIGQNQQFGEFQPLALLALRHYVVRKSTGTDITMGGNHS